MAELEGGNCGLLTHVPEAAVPSVLLLLSLKHCHCASFSFGLGSGWCLFERQQISASHVAKVSYSPHHHTAFSYIFTTMKILSVPVPDTPALVKMCNADSTPLWAKVFPPAVAEGSGTPGT